MRLQVYAKKHRSDELEYKLAYDFLDITPVQGDTIDTGEPMGLVRITERRWLQNGRLILVVGDPITTGLAPAGRLQ